jgi:hypothetical protein
LLNTAEVVVAMLAVGVAAPTAAAEAGRSTAKADLMVGVAPTVVDASTVAEDIEAARREHHEG